MRLRLNQVPALAGLLTLLIAAQFFAPGPLAAQSLSDLVDAARNTGTSLFGSTEFRSAKLSGLPQWNRVLKIMAKEGPKFRRCAADASQCQTPQQRSWHKIITRAAKLSRAEKLKAVNQFFNRWPYKYDMEVYRRREYWAAPTEFMTHSGDCEDYSIAKYFALRELGFSKEELRIVVLWDEIRGMGHAVLSYHGGKDVLVLDSLSNFIVSHTRYKHYIPQVSMNETTRWAHVVRGKKIPTPVATRN